MEAGDMPLCSMHGTADKVVTYSRGIVNPGIPLMYLDGDRMLYAQAKAVGVVNSFYTWLNAAHVPFDNNVQYMDTTVNFVRDFLIGQLGCTNPPLQVADAPFGTATLYAFTPCPMSVATINGKDLIIQAFPN